MRKYQLVDVNLWFIIVFDKYIRKDILSSYVTPGDTALMRYMYMGRNWCEKSSTENVIIQHLVLQSLCDISQFQLTTNVSEKKGFVFSIKSCILITAKFLKNNWSLKEILLLLSKVQFLNFQGRQFVYPLDNHRFLKKWSFEGGCNKKAYLKDLKLDRHGYKRS